MKTNACAFSLLLLAASPLLSARTEERIDRQFAVQPAGQLVVAIDRGSITVHTHADNEVRVSVSRDITRSTKAGEEAFLSASPVTFQSQGDVLTIESHASSRSDSWSLFRVQHTEISYDITVPAGFQVKLRTASGNIAVSDLAGAARADTSSGSLKFTGVHGTIDGRTSSGSIKVVACEGPVNVRTGSGSLTIEDVAGAVQGSTGSGSVTARFSSAPRNDVQLKTSSGSMTLRVADHSAFNLDAATSSGGVRSEVPVTIVGRAARDRLSGSVNGGGQSLVLRSGSGSIRVLRL
jgi:DUF4097 and DUF4098 domain-containing protein YvlB